MKVRYRSVTGLVVLMAVLLVGLVTSASAAEPYPRARPVTLYVHFPSGGPGDITARTLADHFKRVTGQTMLVENRPGGGSLVALNALRQQDADGYTLSFMGRSGMTTYWMQDGKVPFHPVKGFTFISGIAGTWFALVGRSELPFRTLPELIAYAKAQPGKLTFGTLGHGLFTHQPMVEFMRLAGIEMLHVPYKGDPELLVALAGGHLDLAVTGGTFRDLAQAGRVQAIAFLTERRVPGFPSVPTFAELGFPVKASVVVGIGGPAGMNPEIVSYLDRTFRTIAEDPGFRSALERIHQTAEYMSHAEITAWANRQFLAERDIVERFNLKASAR